MFEEWLIYQIERYSRIRQYKISAVSTETIKEKTAIFVNEGDVERLCKAAEASEIQNLFGRTLITKRLNGKLEFFILPSGATQDKILKMAYHDASGNLKMIDFFS